MTDRRGAVACATVVEGRDAEGRRAEESRADVRGGGPGIRATRPGPLARLAARRRVVSADLARLAAALRLAARHDE